MQITLRIYRTHDYDLMSLHCSGIMSFPKAARAALLSYYKGEPLRVSTVQPSSDSNNGNAGDNDVSEDLPSLLEFNITISESTAPGFAKWFSEVRHGYRNNFVKNLLRQSLDGFCVELYRPGSSRPVPLPGISEIPVAVIPVKKKGVTQAKSGGKSASTKPNAKSPGIQEPSGKKTRSKEVKKQSKKWQESERQDESKNSQNNNSSMDSTNNTIVANNSENVPEILNKHGSDSRKISSAAITADTEKGAIVSEADDNRDKNNNSERKNPKDNNDDDFDAFDSFNDLLKGM